jgi:hypothetical protein
VNAAPPPPENPENAGNPDSPGNQGSPGHPAGSGAPGPGADAGEAAGPTLPDDVWEKFVNDSEADIRASAPKEPSARAREVAARLRAEEERARAAERRTRLRRGTLTPGGRGHRPEPWRPGPSGPRAARGGVLRAVLVLALLVGVGIVVLNPSSSWNLVSGHGTGHAAPVRTLAPETTRPSAPPPSADPDRPTPERPFAGSPAERWASGAAAIVPPKARAIGHLTKAQVAWAITETKRYLVATNLDRSTLLGARPAVLTGLLDQHYSGKDVTESFAHPSARHDPLDYASRFDPTEIRLVGTDIRVRGRMTLAEGAHGTAQVKADYTFVYPVERASKSGPLAEVTRTVVRREITLELGNPAYVRIAAGRLLLSRDLEDFANSGCTGHDGYLHPRFASDAPSGSPAPNDSPSPSGTASPGGTASPSPGPTVDPYDRSHDLADRDQHAGCGTASRI